MCCINMQITSTPFSKTGKFSNIVVDYLANEQSLKPFYTWQPELNQFGKIIEGKSKESIDRKMLTEVLLQQYANHISIDKVNNNIQAFESSKTFCIVTAHQLNIFTGPLYVIYKTISAIKLCESLSELHPYNTFVPVFWLGSEDHDFAEINHLNVFGKSLTWDDAQGGACGQNSTTSIIPILEAVTELLGTGINADKLASLFTNAYRGHETLAQATRALLHGLFGHYGLVVIDGDSPRLKSACSDIIEQELFQQTSEQLVKETLVNFPYEAQAKPRNINLFYLRQNSRERIVFNTKTNNFEILNTDVVLSKEAILNEVNQSPEKFSPNVILRPLFQQRVLPSLAYIGGGGEIAYWLQLQSLFEYFNVQFPMLLLRDSFLLIDGAANKKIQKLHFSIEDLFNDENQLINNFVKQNSHGETDITAEKNAVELLFGDLMKKAMVIDAALDKSVLAEKQAVLNAIAKLESKLLKAEKQKMEVQLNQIKTLLSKLFPSGGLQERHDNFIPFYLKYGDGFFDILLENSLQPAMNFTTIVLEEF